MLKITMSLRRSVLYKNKYTVNPGFSVSQNFRKCGECVTLSVNFCKLKIL